MTQRDFLVWIYFPLTLKLRPERLMLYIQKHSIRYVPQYTTFVNFLKISHEASVVELIFGIATDEKSDIYSATDYFGKILVNERVLFFHTVPFFPCWTLPSRFILGPVISHWQEQQIFTRHFKEVWLGTLGHTQSDVK